MGSRLAVIYFQIRNLSMFVVPEFKLNLLYFSSSILPSDEIIDGIVSCPSSFRILVEDYKLVS